MPTARLVFRDSGSTPRMVDVPAPPPMTYRYARPISLTDVCSYDYDSQFLYAMGIMPSIHIPETLVFHFSHYAGEILIYKEVAPWIQMIWFEKGY